MMPSLTQITLSAESLPLEQAERTFILWIDVSLEAMEVEGLERKAEQQPDCLARKPVPPRALAECETHLAPAVSSIEVVKRTRTNHLVRMWQADPPLKQSSRAKQFMDLLDEIHGSVKILKRWRTPELHDRKVPKGGENRGRVRAGQPSKVHPASSQSRKLVPPIERRHHPVFCLPNASGSAGHSGQPHGMCIFHVEEPADFAGRIEFPQMKTDRIAEKASRGLPLPRDGNPRNDT